MNILCISTRVTRKVTRTLKTGDSVNFAYNTAQGEKTALIKITRIIANSTSIVISGSNAEADFILDIENQRYTRISNSDYTVGTTHPIKFNDDYIALNRGSSPWSFDCAEIKKNVEACLPVIGGDTLRKNGCDYQVLAVAGDGKVFVQRELQYGGVKSQVIDPKDESGYTAFGLVSKLKSEIK